MTDRRNQQYGRSTLAYGILVVVLLISAWASASLGQFGAAGPVDLIRLVLSRCGLPVSTGMSHEMADIIWYLRLPRVALAILVGANLAVSGALMQALFVNPMAEPYVVGVSSGAAFGAVLALSLGLKIAFIGLNAVALSAFAGALITTWIVYRIARSVGRVQTGTLLLTGIAVGGLLQAVTTLLLLQSDETRIRSILVWLMGSLAFRDWHYVEALLPYSVIGLALAWAGQRGLNALATGEESAHHLGFSVERLKVGLLFVASLLAASAVASSGIIAFVGLMVPHAMRMLFGADHRRLIPASALGGAILLLWADMLARTVAPGQEIPIGIVTGVVGCLFFLVLLKRQKSRIF